MTSLRALLASGLVWALPAFAQAGPLVEKAEQALRSLEYPNALKALEAAHKQVGNDRATTLRIAELQAVTLATMGQDAKALRAFQVLLCLAPDFKLTGNHPPRVSTALYEARGWLDQHKALEARQLPAVPEEGLVTQLRLEVTNDPLKLVKEVRFHVLVEGKVSELEVPFTAAQVTAPASAPRLSWWAVLLGERKAVLKELASSTSPRIEAAPPLPVAVKPKEVKPDLKPQPKPEPVVEAPEVPSSEMSEWVDPPPPLAAKPSPSGKQVASYALLGGGGVAVGVGVVFGVLANETKAQVTSAQTDGTGRVTGLTQKQALTLDAQQRTQATLANVFIISGAVLAAGGVTLLILSRDDTTVALVPSVGGVGVAGTF